MNFKLRFEKNFLNKRKVIPNINAEKKEINKGLNNLKYPLLSDMVFSKKNIEIIGATSWLPGEINQTPDKRPNTKTAEINPRNFKENNL